MKHNLLLWIIVGIVAFSLVGLSSYFGFWQMTKPTVTLPQPPSQHVSPPVTPETPKPSQPQVEALMPVLQVVWEEIKLPPLKYGYDGIGGFFLEDGGDTISVYRVIGPADGGKATLYSHWRSTDSGKTWNEVEEVIIYTDQERQLGFIPTGWSGNLPNPYFSEGELITGMPDPLTDFGDNPFAVSRDPNNPNNILVIAWCIDSDRHFTFARLFLSLDNHWYQVNFPYCFTPYDAYPETPQLTLLKGAFPSAVSIRIISTDEVSVKLFMAFGPQLFFGKPNTNIKSPN
jgi:hypothetical protein